MPFNDKTKDKSTDHGSETLHYDANPFLTHSIQSRDIRSQSDSQLPRSVIFTVVPANMFAQ